MAELNGILFLELEALSWLWTPPPPSAPRRYGSFWADCGRLRTAHGLLPAYSRLLRHGAGLSLRRGATVVLVVATAAAELAVLQRSAGATVSLRAVLPGRRWRQLWANLPTSKYVFLAIELLRDQNSILAILLVSSERVCEPSYFPVLNSVSSLHELGGLNCRHVTYVEDHLAPFWARHRLRCAFLSNHLLFSCAGGRPGVQRVCPCRDFKPGQIALCLDCVWLLTNPTSKEKPSSTLLYPQRTVVNGHLPQWKRSVQEMQATWLSAPLQIAPRINIGKCSAFLP